MSTSSELFFAALAKLQNPLNFQQPSLASDANVEPIDSEQGATSTPYSSTPSRDHSPVPLTVPSTNTTGTVESIDNTNSKPLNSIVSKRRRKPDGKYEKNISFTSSF